MVGDLDVGIGAAERLPHPLIAGLEVLPPQLWGENHGVLGAEIVARPDHVHAQLDHLQAALRAVFLHAIQERGDVLLLGHQIYQELLQPHQVPGQLKQAGLQVADDAVVCLVAGDDVLGEGPLCGASGSGRR